MATFRVLVEIIVEAESSDEAEYGMRGALDNLMGDDFKDYMICDTIETGVIE